MTWRCRGHPAERRAAPSRRGEPSFSKRVRSQESAPPELPRRSAPPATRRHDALVRLQRADGSWQLDRRLLDVIGVEQDRLVALAATVGGGAQGEAIVATLAAVAFLEAHASEHRDEWSSLAAKATRWVEAALASLGMGGASDRLSPGRALAHLKEPDVPRASTTARPAVASRVSKGSGIGGHCEPRCRRGEAISCRPSGATKPVALEIATVPSRRSGTSQ